MNENGTLKVENAVNPLFSLVEKKAVSLDIELNQEKILLLSGPNAGGKTVVLKSIGLYVLMAQCGLYIPAKKAQFPVYTKFMADIGDRQSMENDLSTFSAHIQNLATIVAEANESSLILLDELGTGTDPDAGAALSRAIMEFFIKKHCTVIATTHLGSLKVWASDERGIINGGMIFDSDALAPTYELQLGTPGASYALEISKRMGLSEDIINRSSELVGDGSVNLENILGQLEKERLVAESLRIDLENREKELEQIETQTFNKEKEINKAHKKAKNTALLEAEKIILSARREAENLIAEIRVNQADKKTIKKVKDQFQNTLENLQIQDKTAEEEFNSLLESDLQKGSIIYIPHLNSKGKIIHLPDKKNRVRVEVNGITLTLKLAELQRAEASESSESNSKPNISMNKTFSIAKIQIDLRGMRVDEALHETEKHLDSALISGMSFVHILHGKGTGALMEAIHEFLSEQSFVANFHFADEDQGGAGITVVEFE
jgi:DNA mismatch repair protein MutS2